MRVGEHILDAMIKEIEVIKHLATKIPGDGLDYRPTPAQRSTLELLRYLTYGAIHGVHGLASGWKQDPNVLALQERAHTLERPGFAGAMDEQADALRHAMSMVSDEDLAAKVIDLPWGGSEPLCRMLLMFGPQCLAAYRMQLFLYVKAAGNHDVNTENCWFGRDAQP